MKLPSYDTYQLKAREYPGITGNLEDQRSRQTLVLSEKACSVSLIPVLLSLGIETTEVTGVGEVIVILFV